MTRVLIVASSAVVRAGLEAILAGRSSLEVVGSIPTLPELLAGIDSLKPEVILVDVEGSPNSPSTPTLQSSGSEGGPAVVLLIGEPGEPGMLDLLRRGVRAMLPRGAEPHEIVAAVEAAASGLLVLHPVIAEGLLPLLAAPSPRPATGAGVETLTPREIEVLALLAEGAGNKQLARRLGISEHTIKFHVGSILAKLGASSRTEAVTLGVRQGLIMV